jgi:hypothetical protein
MTIEGFRRGAPTVASESTLGPDSLVPGQVSEADMCLKQSSIGNHGTSERRPPPAPSRDRVRTDLTDAP